MYKFLIAVVTNASHWLKTTHVYYLMVLSFKSATQVLLAENRGVSRAVFLLEALENPLPCLFQRLEATYALGS